MLNFKFEKIILHNFFSFVHEELDLENYGICLVNGLNHCKVDNALSNGSGKSSLFSAISYVFTGKTIQGVHNGVENIYGDKKDCYVEIYFTLNEKRFIIKRIKTPWHKLEINLDGKDISGKTLTESEEILKTYIPNLSLKMIGTAIIWGQGTVYKFSNYVPAERKRTLEEFTSADSVIENLINKFSLRLSDLKDLKAQTEGVKVSTISEKKVHQNQKEVYLSKLGDGLEDINKLKEELEKTREEKQKVVDEKNIEIEEIKSQNEKINKLTEDYSRKKDALQVKEQSLRSKSLDLSHSKKIISKELISIKNRPDLCPTCGQKMPAINEEHLKELNENFQKVSEDENKLSEELSQIKSRITELDSDFKLSLKTKDTTKLNVLTKEEQNLDRKISALLNKISEAEKIESIKLFLENIEKDLERLEEKEKECDSILNDSLLRIDAVNKLLNLVKKDFRAVMLNKTIIYLNSIIEKYSNIVFGSSRISLEATKMGVDIFFGEKLYENLSGGEKQKVDLIIQLALRDFLAFTGCISSNILCLDEIFDNLDKLGFQKILSLISSITSLESIFIITHHETDLEISYDHTILVEKFDNKGSVIKVE